MVYAVFDLYTRILSCVMLASDIGTSSIVWAKLIRFHLKMEIDSSLRNDVHFK
jgi:hypothetical protein